MLTNEHNYPCNFTTIYFFLHEPVAWHKQNTRMRWILYVMCVRVETDLDRAETSQQALGSPGLFQVIKCCRHASFLINYISLSGLFKGSESSAEFWRSLSFLAGDQYLKPLAPSRFSSAGDKREMLEFKYSRVWEYSAEAQEKQFQHPLQKVVPYRTLKFCAVKGLL